MAKLDLLSPNLERHTGRRASFGNLYRDDNDLSPDHYDSVKIAKVNLKARKRSDALVDMSKQKRRDMNEMLKTTEFYKNVQRDNHRNDFIKNLLKDAEIDN